jgi:hypothetical protein
MEENGETKLLYAYPKLYLPVVKQIGQLFTL